MTKTKHETLDSLVATFEEWSGLKVAGITGIEHRRRLWVNAPSGVVLLILDAFKVEEEGWKFGGFSSPFPNDWSTLCRM
jgi:hypothetical protein